MARADVKGFLERLASAYRRVGLSGVWNDLRWRLRRASGGRGLFRSIAASIRVLFTGGPKSLIDRVRYGAHLWRGGTVPQGVAEGRHEPHPWTLTFAYDAAFSQHFDLDEMTLEKNRIVVERFDDRPGKVKTATWFLTYFDHAWFGGVRTILRTMDYMTRRHGVRHRLVLFDRTGVRDEVVRKAITEVFPGLRGIDIVLPTEEGIPYEELPPTDIGVCTMWISAFPLARFNDCAAKFYFVQDFEPAFYPAGTLSALAESTYRLGFGGIVNTPGLARVYESYGNPAMEFTPAVDQVVDVYDKPSQRGGPVQIAVYGRPKTDRNAFELIASASTKLKERFGDGVRIVSAGEDWEPRDLGLDGVIENMGRLMSLKMVEALYRASDIGVCFMLSKHPSYQPFEYLAAYAAPVCNTNEATSWFLKDGENCLITEPFPSEIARTVARLVEDEELRRKIAESGHAEVAALDWESELDRVWDFVTGR